MDIDAPRKTIHARSLLTPLGIGGASTDRCSGAIHEQLLRY